LEKVVHNPDDGEGEVKEKPKPFITYGYVHILKDMQDNSVFV